MSVRICTMPECQTTAGCQCGNRIVKTPMNTLITILDAKDTEISKLKADLREATDIITMGIKGIDILLDEFIPAFRDLVTELGASEEQIERIGLDLLEGEDSIRPRARAFLSKHQRAE